MAGGMDVGAAMYSCAFSKLFTKNVLHILEKIFFSLDYKSFEVCMMVSKTWKELLTSESFKMKRKSVFCEHIERELYQATENNNLNVVKSILSSGMVDTNCIWKPYGRTPLVWAAHKGHKEVVQLLLERGAEPNIANSCGDTPLLKAAYRGHNDVVQLLLDEGADPNKVNTEGATPLLWAAAHGKKDVVRLLLDRGADPNKAEQRGQTPLHWAAAKGHQDVVQQLLLRGADKNAVAASGSTPLNLAQTFGRTAIVRILQDAGALQ